MGGSALLSKNVITRRYNAAEYKVISQSVLDILGSDKIVGQTSVIKSYSNKLDYGDLDVLMDYLVSDSAIQRLFNPTAIVRNGPVVSFDYLNFQIDFITVKSNEYEFSANYFAFNDLGNLIGRIAHSLGFKFGNTGLWYNLVNPDCETQVIEKILVSQNFDLVLTFLGLDANQYHLGFESLEDIFSYVHNSDYFHKDSFLLENRNNKDRARDLKRPTYMAFLDYIKVRPALNDYFYKDALTKVNWQSKAWIVFPEFFDSYTKATLDHYLGVAFKAKLNGVIVSKLTGLEYKELGLFMLHLNTYIEETYGLGSINGKQYVTGKNQEWINALIIAVYKNYIKK